MADKTVNIIFTTKELEILQRVLHDEVDFIKSECDTHTPNGIAVNDLSARIDSIYNNL